MNDIEGEIDDVTASIYDLEKAIDQIKWDNLTEVHDRMSSLHDDISDVRDVLSNEDMYDEFGNFTDAGIATIGTHIQDVEMWKNELAEVNKELANLKPEDFDSEQDYYDKWSELTETQHSYTKSIKESENAIIEMYENQISESLVRYI